MKCKNIEKCLIILLNTLSQNFNHVHNIELKLAEAHQYILRNVRL